MSITIFQLSILLLTLTLSIGCSTYKKDEYTSHNHSDAIHADHNNHSDHAHGHENKKSHKTHTVKDTHENKDTHSEETEIEVAPEFMKMAGITLAKVSRGKISASLDVSGEIGFNEDRLVHITPRFPGIIKEANYKLGEFVNAGSVVATIESNESLNQYSLKAPISGRVIEKHALSGEHVSEEESIYLLADLSMVWVNLAVYPKDASKVKVGQNVTISAVGSDNITVGTIQYISPVMDPQTRRITARVVLPNGNNQWRPGSFVKAHLEISESEEGLVVDRNAVQTLENNHVIFVQHEPSMFKPVKVTIGESDSHKTRILAGLETGTFYVNNGAFELKAKIITSSLGEHAGHGH